MKSFAIYLLLNSFCLGAITTYAQSDSIRTEYRTEDERVFRSEIQRVIRYYYVLWFSTPAIITNQRYNWPWLVVDTTVPLKRNLQLSDLL